jgi:hypothetical protein
MTSFELLWWLSASAGALVGGQFGYSHFGIGGAVLGILIGGAVGSLAALVLALLLAVFLHVQSGNASPPPRPPGDEDHPGGSGR